MIKPNDLYITEEEFDKIILDAEVEFMKERSKTPPENRKSCVQFWVKLTPADIPVEYVYKLEESYVNAGWDNVQVVFVDDAPTKLMVYLSMD